MVPLAGVARCPLVPAAVHTTGRGWPMAAYRRSPVSGVSSATQAVARWTARDPAVAAASQSSASAGAAPPRSSSRRLARNRSAAAGPDQPARPAGAGEDQRAHAARQRQHVEPVTFRPRPPGGGQAAG